MGTEIITEMLMKVVIHSRKSVLAGPSVRFCMLVHAQLVRQEDMGARTHARMHSRTTLRAGMRSLEQRKIMSMLMHSCIRVRSHTCAILRKGAHKHTTACTCAHSLTCTHTHAQANFDIRAEEGKREETMTLHLWLCNIFNRWNVEHDETARDDVGCIQDEDIKWI